MDKIASVIKDALNRHKGRKAADDLALEDNKKPDAAPVSTPKESEPAKEPEQAPASDNALLPPSASKEDLKNALVERVYQKLQDKLESEMKQMGGPEDGGEQEGAPQSDGGHRRGPRIHYHNPNEVMKAPKEHNVPMPKSKNPSVHAPAKAPAPHKSPAPKSTPAPSAPPPPAAPAATPTADGDDAPSHANFAMSASARILTAAEGDFTLDSEVTPENMDAVMKYIGERQDFVKGLDTENDPDDDEEDDDNDDDIEPKKTRRQRKKKVEEIEHDTLRVIHNLTEMVKMLVENFPPKKTASARYATRAIEFVANDEIRMAVKKYVKADLVFDTKEQEKEYRKQHEVKPDTKIVVKENEDKKQKNTPDEDAAEEAFMGLPQGESDKVYNDLGGQKQTPQEFKTNLVNWHQKTKQAPKQEAPTDSQGQKHETTPGGWPKSVEGPNSPFEKTKTKQEAPKQEAPKQEAPKPEAPKQEAPTQKQKVDEANKALNGLPEEKAKKVYEQLGGASAEKENPEAFQKKLVDWHDSTKPKKPEAPKQEAPKQEAPKPKSNKPSWLKDDAPLSGSDHKEMQNRGFKKQKAPKLSDDSTVVDVSTGKEYKLSELPSDVRKAFEAQNEKEGVWHAPSEGGSSTPAPSKAPEKPAEKKPEGKPEEKSEKKEEAKPAEKKPEEKKEEPKPEKKEEKKEEKKPEKKPLKDRAKARLRKISDVDYKNESTRVFDSGIANELEDDDVYDQYSALKENDRSDLLNDIISDSGRAHPTIQDLIKGLSKHLPKYSKGGEKKAAALINKVIANITLQNRLAEKLASDFVARKDKDLMMDTGGKSKKRPSEPTFKPSRTDLKDSVREKSKTKEEKDADNDGNKDPDMRKD